MASPSAKGRSNAEIARRAAHERGDGQDACVAILAKLELDNRVQIALLVHEAGRTVQG